MPIRTAFSSRPFSHYLSHCSSQFSSHRSSHFSDSLCACLPSSFLSIHFYGCAGFRLKHTRLSRKFRLLIAAVTEGGVTHLKRDLQVSTWSLSVESISSFIRRSDLYFGRTPLSTLFTFEHLGSKSKYCSKRFVYSGKFSFRFCFVAV